jgi:MFS family permease
MTTSNVPARTGEQSRLKSAEFRAVMSMTLLIMFGFGLIVPTLPLFAKRFGVGEAGVGLLLTAFAATRLAADFVAGGLIDRFGERAMVASGAAIVGLSSLAAGAAPNYPALVALRGVGGVGSAFFLGGLTAHLIGTVSAEERGRAMGVFQAMIGVGLLVGPLVGGLIAAAGGLRAPLFVYGAICLVATPVCVRVVGGPRVPAASLAEAPELEEVPALEEIPAPEMPAWSRLRPLLGDSAYRAAIVAAGAGFYVSGGIQTLVPGFWEDVLHRSRGSVGVPFTILALTSLAVIWHSGSLSDRRGRKFVLVPALGGTAAVAAATGFSTGAAAMLALIALLGVVTGYARPGPTSMVADVASVEQRAVAVAGYRTAGDVGALVGPIVVGVVAQSLGYRAAFIAVGAGAAVSFVLMLASRETAPGRQAPAPSRA